MAKIPEGCILLARKILKSSIWQQKPSWWLKVWIYILMEVNHKDNALFKRGENFFNYKEIFNDCNLITEGNDTKSIDNLMRWLKSTGQITTHKTTRGFIISVCNYEYYQNLVNYKNDTQNDIGNEIETKQKRNRNDTINNNDNNDNNEISKRIGEFFNYFLLKTKKNFRLTQDKRELIEKRLNEGYTLEQLKQAVDNFIQDPWEGRPQHFDLIYCIGKQRGKPDNLEKWLNFKNEKQVRYV